jgi:hypothetical protein
MTLSSTPFSEDAGCYPYVTVIINFSKSAISVFEVLFLIFDSKISIYASNFQIPVVY